MGRAEWERLLLCWTREIARDPKSTAIGSVGTFAVHLGTNSVNPPYPEWNCTTPSRTAGDHPPSRSSTPTDTNASCDLPSFVPLPREETPGDLFPGRLLLLPSVHSFHVSFSRDSIGESSSDVTSFVAVEFVVLRSFDVEATHVRRCDLHRRRGEDTTDETCTWKTREGRRGSARFGSERRIEARRGHAAGTGYVGGERT